MSDLKLIAGSGGKSGGGGGGAIELPDSLRSIAVARVIDLICEGPVKGLVDGARSIYLDETPLEVIDSDGKVVRNFKGVTFVERLGEQDQSYIPEFPSSESEIAVGVRVKYDTPVTRTISTPGLDAVRVTVSIPGLSYQDVTTGNVYGAMVTLKLSVSENGGAYVDQVIGYTWDDDVTIVGNVMTTVNYAHAIRLTVNGQCPNWQLMDKAGSKLTYEIQYKSTIDADWTTYKVVVIEPKAAIVFSRSYEITGLPLRVYSVRLTNGSGGVVTLNSGAFGTQATQDSIIGKTMSKYQRSYRVNLPGEGPWTIKLSRITPDATEATVQNQTWWESYTEIVDAKFRYPNSALVAVSADASQFSSIPRRAFDMYLREVRVPVNYDPITKVYDGIWDGSFKTAWTDNPAWCFYDLVTHTRYGLGHMITESLVDKWTLFGLGQYCDELVPSGFTDSEGEIIYEPRFTLNCYIQSREEAYKVIQDLASTFRGMTYWAQGTITATQDAPATPSMLFTPSNVTGGTFSYTGSAKKARHTVALISWNDPTNLCKTAVEYVEDPVGIARYGVNEIQQVAFGCTSRGQAHRVGLWILYSERYETDVVTFQTGMEGCYCRPGHVIQIADPIRSSKRLGGRILAADETSVTVDAPVLVEDGKDYYLSCILPDGSLEEAQAYSSSSYFYVEDGAGVKESFATSDGSDFIVKAAEQELSVGEQTEFAAVFSQVPQSAAVWIMRISDLEPQQFRVISVTEPEAAIVEIVALEHNPDKYNYIEYGMQLEDSPCPPSPLGFLTPPRNVTAAQELYTDELGTVRLRAIVHWEASLDARTIAYLIRWRRGDDNWTESRTDTLMVTMDGVSPGSYVFEVTAVSMENLKSAAVAITYVIAGLSDAPPDVTGLDTVAGGGVYTSLDCGLKWDSVISSSFPASLLKHYEVKILNTDDSPRRTEIVHGNTYTYTWANNYEDGTPVNAFKVEVSAVAVNNVPSVNPAELSVTHTTLSPSLSLTATGMLMSVKLRIAGITREQYQAVEIWVSESNDRAAATLLVSTQDQEYTHANLPVAAVRYYWIHPVDPFGEYMPWHPLSATAGITGVVISDPSDLIDLLDTGETGAIIVTGEINGVPTAGINGDMIVDGTILARCIATGQLIVGDNVTMGEAATIEWSQVDNAPNTTKLDANGIYTGTLTATQVTATNFVAGSANIGDLTVDTLHVKNGAITNTENAYTAGAVAVSSGETTIQSLAITSSGAPILLDATAIFAATMSAEFVVSIYRGTTRIFGPTESIVVPSFGAVPVSFALTNAPAAGSYTYYFKASCTTSGSASASNRTIRTLEVKK